MLLDCVLRSQPADVGVAAAARAKKRGAAGEVFKEV